MSEVCGRPVDVSGYRFNIPEPYCSWPAGHDYEHPCGTQPEALGDPCRFCGVPIASRPCPDCWTPMPENYADQKALLALGGFDTGLPSADP